MRGSEKTTKGLQKKGGRKIVLLVATTLALAGCASQSTMQRSGKPPKHGTAQQIHLVWNGKDWSIKGATVPPGKFHTSIPKGDGPTEFVVDISGNGATFNASAPLSVWVGDKSQPPQTPGTIDSTQILGPIVDKNGKELIFYDLNYGDEVTLNYSLYFNEPGVPAVDPIIDNGGNWL